MDENVKRVGWAVTELDGTTIIVRSDRLSTRVLEVWTGTARLWRVGPNGVLLQLTDDEFQYADDRAHGRR